ncbi:MAG: hypothetical protein VR64_03755 [Desulfatitalea sp. BRH_c12]|nr:MAG: hypothetical protein VR64_03755 [Desulfatitalea sp. BRH_c12]
MANYIVRIYRFEGTRQGGVVGLVETIGREVKTAFTTVDELWRILKAENDRRGPNRVADLTDLDID